MAERTVILASASRSRARMLTAAGVPFTAVPAHVDEDAVKASLRHEGATAAQCAETLAELKAVKISQRHTDALVVGADQILEAGGEWFDKPVDMDHAAGHLRALRGKAHTLATSVVVALNGSRIWHAAAAPRLVMRRFTDAFIDAYLAQVGEDALLSVGAYQLEGRGAQLFTSVDGDFFSVLGLPLLPLLSFLREHRVVAS